MRREGRARRAGRPGQAICNQYVYVDPASGVTIVKLSANRFYGTTADLPANRDGEYLATVARSLG